MITLKIVLIVIALVSTIILALSIRVVLVKDGKFPEAHIIRNLEIKKSVPRVKKVDQMEQAQSGLHNKYKNVTV